jgi:hypothetical protein
MKVWTSIIQIGREELVIGNDGSLMIRWRLRYGTIQAWGSRVVTKESAARWLERKG